MSARLTILIKKVDSLSDEEFHKSWSESHPKVWLNVKIVQEKVVKYSQLYVDSTTSHALAVSGLPISEHNGGANIWANSVEDLTVTNEKSGTQNRRHGRGRERELCPGSANAAKRIFQDEEYLRVVVPDEEKFIQRHEAKLMVGYDKDLWVDGKAV